MKGVDKLFDQEDGVSLGAFRVVFGIIMTLQFMTFIEQVPLFVGSAKFLFTYDFFHWIKPIPEPYMTGLLTFLVVNSLVFATGRFYRLTAIIQFMGMFYVFHLGKALYNNHYYLFILLSLLMVFLKGNAALVAFKKSSSSAPRWHRLLLQAQIVIVFVYGGIAKMNSEWLFHFQPVRAWLPDMLGAEVMKVISETQLLWMAGFLCYAGMIFDLAIGFLILNPKTRKARVPIYIGFHLMNAAFFHIGLFPWFCIGALALFLEQQTIQDFLNKVHRWFLRDKRTINPVSELPQNGSNRIAKVFFFGWLFFQIIIPLRHWFIDGWVMWDERGYNFSWFMKLRTKEPKMAFKVNIGENPTDYYLELEKFLTKKQGRSIGYKPINTVQFAHYIEQYYHERGETQDIRVYADVSTQLHDHPPQRLINPDVDLTSLDIDNHIYFGRYDWIVPFQDK